MDTLDECKFILNVTRSFKEFIKNYGVLITSVNVPLTGAGAGGSTYLVGPAAYARLIFIDTRPGVDPDSPASQTIIAQIASTIRVILPNS
jgi:hypothetical protein